MPEHHCKHCGEQFIPGKTGGNEMCNRDRMRKERGLKPGVRERQSPGSAKVPMRCTILPELAERITPAVLKKHGVKEKYELLELALAKLLGAPELVSFRLREPISRK